MPGGWSLIRVHKDARPIAFKRFVRDGEAAMPFFFFNISEHADGERRGRASIPRHLTTRLNRDVSDAALRFGSSPRRSPVGMPRKVVENKK